MALQLAKRSAKSTIGFAGGIAVGVTLVSFLDDMLYNDLRKKVFMSYQMVKFN